MHAQSLCATLGGLALVLLAVGTVEAMPPKNRVRDERVTDELVEEELQLANEVFEELAELAEDEEKYLDAAAAQQALLRMLSREYSLELLQLEMAAKDVDDPETHREDKISLAEFYRFVNHMRDKASDVLEEEYREQADAAFDEHSVQLLTANGAQQALLAVLGHEYTIEEVEREMDEKHDPEHHQETLTRAEFYRFINHMREEHLPAEASAEA